MEQRLKLYKYDNGELVSFPSKESPIEIGVFTYTAKRMGDAPTITATINYKECLDNLWTGKECVIFNDEFFYVKNIPTSSYSNTDSRYKHECTFVNERSKLNGVLFTDVVDDKASDGKPVSNSSKFYFNGNITEFVARLNASLRYAKLQTIDNGLVYGYHVVIDEGTKAIENFNDTFNVSFEDKTISEAIQEVYNSYNIPYYFEGKTVHVGLIDEEHDLLSDIDGGFKYGVNNELISISKSNKNNKIINRITALGSSENLPYYYPNETEKGSVTVTEYGKDTIPSYVELFNPFLFAKRIGNDDKIHYLKGDASWSTGVSIYEGDDSLDFKNVSFDESVKVKRELEDGSVQPVSNIKICFSIHIKDRKDYFTIKPYIAIDNSAFGGGYEYSFNKDLVVEAYLSNESGRIDLVAGDEKFNTVEIPVGTYQLWITYKVSHRYAKRTSVASFIDKDVKVKLEVFNSYEKFWFLNDSTTRYNLEDFGLRLIGGVSPYNGMAFAQKVTIPYYPVSQNLILPIYRSTQGEERFYNAYNATYKDENGNYYNFKNEYAEDSISEHIVKFDDIKPTIKGVEYNGRRIDKFVEFAYDKSDNDLKQVVEDKEEYQHPYFFAKLPPLGFNLFDHALETGEMTISMTSGHCAGCSFTIMVNDANKNTVQVDEDGNLKYDEGGYVLVGSVNGQGNQSPIDSQNDTTDNSVWIALKKDIDSFGTILPSSNIKPSNNDTFVITNILLPQEYIEAAEERLKNEAIKYMAENNSSKFSFSIKFSRIFLAENPTIFDKISENSRIAVNYNGSIYPLHVSSYSYKMSEGALLPEIDVSLTDSVVISTNAIESAVSEAKADVLTYVDRYATLEEATTIFIRKDKEDYSPSPMVYGRSLTVNESHKVGENLDVAKNATIGEKTTTKTIQVGEQASVGNYVEGVSGIVMKIDTDGSSYMELDRLKVRMKAYFDELEVQKVNTVGGKMIMSPAGSFTCGAVLTSEELIANGEDVDTTNGSFYRCFFNAVQDDEQIENKFIVGDFAFSQSFNLTGRSSNKMYWREVVGVSSTYVDLSYDKCALDSDIPSSGDIICQLGSKVKDRQNAIVMTTVDDYAPAITLHYGIDKFSLSGTEIIQYGVRNGKAFFNSYGDMFLGEKPVEGVSNAYMKYTTEGGLEICGKLTVGTTYGDKTIGELINEAKPEDYEDFKAAVTKEFENIRNELDGVIDTWFGDDTPTLENYPASEWVTNTDKDSHLGDLYYTSDGKAYRFQYRDTEGYYWAAIEDSEVVKALELAQKALDTADGKRRVFIDTPYPPYDLGDLWAGGENQPLKRCINEKIEGLSFSEGDWALADDSHAYSDAIKRELEETISNTKNDLDKAVEDAEKAAKDYTDEGKNALQESIDALNAAKADIDNVYTKAEADSEITRAEAEAIAAAKNHANAAIELSEETTKAYADGIVTEEEEARIEQAKENLAEAKAYAEEKANEAFANAQREIAGYEYLKEALKQDTTVEGGIIQTSTIRLGYQEGETRTTTAGVNGVVLPENNGEDIAFWAGGDMIDAEKENSANAAKFVVRMDGSGYFSNKEITWTKEGELNFSGGITIGGEKEETLGSLLENITNLKKTINRWFQEENGVLKTPLPFASDSTVSSLGVGTDGTGGVSYDRLDSWNSYTDDKAGYVLSAALGWDLKTRLDNLDLGDFDLSGYYDKGEVNDLLTGKQDVISDLGTIKRGAALGATALQPSDLDEYVNEITTSGSGNAITSVTKSGKNLTFNKASSFFLTENFTKSNIKTTLGISDWALASSKPSYKTSEVAEDSNLYFTTDRVKNYLTGAVSSVLTSDLTASRALISNASGKISVSAVTSTELGYLDGVTSAIQTQLNALSSRIKAYEDILKIEENGTLLHATVALASDSTLSSLGVGSDEGGTGGAIDLTNVVSHIIPSLSNAYTIGNANTLWKAVYATELYAGNVAVGSTIASLQSTLGTATSNIQGLTSSLSSVTSRVGNIETNYLPLSGGTITGRLKLKGQLLEFDNADGSFNGYLSSSVGDAMWYKGGTWHTLIHSGNIGSQSVASATKLATARTIWGHSFDGTGDVNGDLHLNGSKIYWYSDAANYCISSVARENVSPYLKIAHYGGIALETGGTEKMRIQSNGNVGIGTANPEYKHHIIGESLISQSANGYLFYRARGVSYELGFGLGSGGTNRGIYDFTNESWMIYRDGTTSVLIPNGNVLIGTTIDRGYKLYVSGNIKSTAIKTNTVCIECGETGETGSYGGEINRFEGNLYLQNRQGTLYLSYTDGSTVIRSAATIGGAYDLAGSTYKLYVNGDSYVNGSLVLSNNYNLMFLNSSSEALGTLTLTNTNDLVMGWGTAGKGYNTYIDGYKVCLRYGTSHTPGLILNSAGNVLIGTTTDSGKGRLQVNGGVALNNIEFIPSASANHGGYMNFHYQGSTDDYTSRIIEDSRSSLCFYANYDRFGGAVTIGSTSNLANTNNVKLYVNGTFHASGNATFDKTVFINSSRLYKSNGALLVDTGSTANSAVKASVMQVNTVGVADDIDWAFAATSQGGTSVNTTNSGVGISLGGYAKGNADSQIGRGAGIAAVAELGWYSRTGIAFYVNHGTSESVNQFTEKLRLTGYGNLIPIYNTSAQSLGSSDARWVAYLNSADVSGNATIGGTLNVTDAATFGSTLKVTGAIESNALRRWDGTTANETPFVHGESNNTDITLLRASYATAKSYKTSGAYGFSLKYIGTGEGNANYLKLLADNQTATSQVLAICVDQSGNVGIGTENNSSYKLEVGGTLGVTGATTLSDKLTISKNGMSVAGTAYFGGGTTYYFGSTGNIYANTLSAAATTLRSTLSVTSTSTFTGKTTHNGGIGATSGTFSSTLGVTGVATFNNNIKAKKYIYFGANDEAWIYWDATNNVLRTNASFASDGTMSSLGVGSDEGGGGSADWGAVPTNIIPAVNGGYNLGSASSHWSKLYVSRIENSDDDLYLNSGGYIRMLTDVVFGNNDDYSISPTGTAYLGNIYSNGNIVATTSWVDSKLNGYYTKEESDNKYLYKGYDGNTFEINSDFKIAYATSSLLKLENKVNNDVRIAFIGNGTILGYIGMNGSSPVFIDPEGGKHIIALKDDNANVDLSNYYTKTETNSAISSMLSNYALKTSLGTAASYGVTTSVTSGSTNLVTSGAVYSVLSGYVSKSSASTISAKLTVNEFSSNGSISTGGNLSVYGNITIAMGGLTAANGTVSAKTVTQTSDERLKNLIGDVRLSLGSMACAPLKKFHYHDDGLLRVGTLAQYWQGTLPEVVSTTPNGTLALAYGELGVAMGISLANHLTELKTDLSVTDSEVEKLKKRVEQLETENKRLQERVDALVA